ncbi:MAG: peptidase [Acidobacteria bacterium]|jgi:C1A family cysteine protease|nr:MAG: peptidase [Acidobacteriota bacterium]
MRQKLSRYGWIPDLPDARDHLFKAPRKAGPLPSSMDLRSGCPPVYDQGGLGSCTANAIGAAIEFDQRKQELEQRFTPSRLFIYYNERALEGTINTDSGGMLRDGMKTVAADGACPETLWPYSEEKFAERPSALSYEIAKTHPVVRYSRLAQSLGQMKACLAAGFPFVFGFTVYESFEGDVVARTGVASIPDPSETILGGHAVMAVGYDDQSSRFLIRNSWGANWGMGGHFTMPYAYLTDNNLADDFWTIRLVR